MATLIQYEGFHMLNVPRSDELPPKMYLMQILDPVSKIYCFLWEKKDNNNRVKMSWDDVARIYNKNNFRSSLRKLNCFSLLDYVENKDHVEIELVGWSDEEFE